MMEREHLFTNAQGGWRKGRSAQQKIKLLTAAIEYSMESPDNPIHIAYVDLSKAVNHNYLSHVLEKSGFSSHFVEIIKEMNTDNKCKVITAYGLTEAYPIERGVRQGCPMSPLLFTLYTEPLMRWLEQDEGYMARKVAKLIYSRSQTICHLSENRIQT